MVPHPPSRSEHRRARLIALAVAFVLPSVLTWLYFVRLAAAPAAVQQLVYAAGKSLQFALPLVVVVWVLRRPLRRGRPPRRGLTEGLISGLVVCASTALLYRLLSASAPELMARVGDQVAAKVADLGIAGGYRYLAVAVFYSLVHSGLEEYYWRWFVYGQTRRFLGTRPAILLAALGFMAHHVILVAVYTGWTWPTGAVFSLAVAAGGAYWCWLYERSGSLAGPWLSHVLVDVALFTVGWLLLT